MAQLNKANRRNQEFVEAPGDNPEAYYDMAPQELQNLPPEILNALGLSIGGTGPVGGEQMPNRRPLTPSQAQPLDDANAEQLLQGILSQIGPVPDPNGGGSRLKDQYFQQAMQQWMEEFDREPASDGDFAEIEEMAVELMQDGERAVDNNGYETN